MRHFKFAFVLLGAVFLLPSLCVGAPATKVKSTLVETAPVLDGVDGDPAWAGVKPVIVKDQASGAMILLRAVHTRDKVYFSVQFPDKAQTPLHKPWIWNAEQKAYETGAHREDTFVFKWNMMDKAVDLSNFSDDSYTADVWYWKANRTNLAGYADDKHHELGDRKEGKVTEVTSVTGKPRYLARKSDQGKSAYQDYKPTTYEGDLVDRYRKRTPEGSRADVKAKGKWGGGFWYIEFERAMHTGHDDDVQFDPSGGQEYQFGISVFSLYGKPHDPNSPNLYGRGRISPPLVLSF